MSQWVKRFSGRFCHRGHRDHRVSHPWNQAERPQRLCHSREGGNPGFFTTKSTKATKVRKGLEEENTINHSLVFFVLFVSFVVFSSKCCLCPPASGWTSNCDGTCTTPTSRTRRTWTPSKPTPPQHHTKPQSSRRQACTPGEVGSVPRGHNAPPHVADLTI